MAAVTAWAVYAAWVALFASTGWPGRRRLLLTLGAMMLLGLAVSAAYPHAAMPAPDRDHSADAGYGVLILFAAAVLLLPPGIAAVAYPIGRLRAR